MSEFPPLVLIAVPLLHAVVADLSTRFRELMFGSFSHVESAVIEKSGVVPSQVRRL
jgi:hypothetical protein